MGSGVYRNPVKEIGWFPVQGIPAGEETICRFLRLFKAFHWHGETFDEAHCNVKEINFADIEDLVVNLEARGLSRHYRKHIRDTLKMFPRTLCPRGPSAAENPGGATLHRPPKSDRQRHPG